MQFWCNCRFNCRFNCLLWWQQLSHVFLGATCLIRARPPTQAVNLAAPMDRTEVPDLWQHEEESRGMVEPEAMEQFPELQQGQLQSPSRLEALPAVQDWLSRSVSGLTEEQLTHLQLAIAEAFTNAVRHAHRDLDEQTPIELHVTQRGSQIDLEIWDHGQPFDLQSHLTETLHHYAHGDLLEEESGRGLLFIHRLVDSMIYRRVGDRNCLLLSKSLVPVASVPPVS